MQQGSLALGSTSLSLTDVSPRSRPVHGPRRFAVDLFDGRDFVAARWPSVAAGPELQMHAFQSREFLDIWSRILSLLPAIDVVDLQKMPAAVGAAHNPLTYLAGRPYRFSGNAVDLGQWREVAARPSTVRVHRKLQRHLRRLSKVEPTAFLMNPSGPQWQEVMDRLTEVKRKQYLRTTALLAFAAATVRDAGRRLVTIAEGLALAGGACAQGDAT